MSERAVLQTHLLLIECDDEPGLIWKISGTMFRAGFNIISNHEFVDPESGRFFMRTEFIGLEPQQALEEIRALLPRGVQARLSDLGQRNIVLLVTREAHCLGELLLRHSTGDLGAKISGIIGNHDTLADLARRFDIPFRFISHEGIDRPTHERMMASAIDEFAPDFVVLAKYMRVLSPEFVGKFAQRMINIHHSFLPAFSGANPYRQAFQRGVKIIGATAHFVTADLDEGPIISQSVIPTDHSQGPAAMAQAGRDVEKIVLAKALRLVLEERVFLVGNRTIVFE